MSSLLSMTQLMAPSVPAWLEETCDKLRNNDPSFCTVDLTHPHLDDVGAKVFARSMQSNTIVDTLILSCYSMVDDGPHAVASVLETNRAIQRLQLKDLRHAREITTFFDWLRNNRSLVEISLRHCTICSKTAVSISRFLRDHPKVQEFRVTDCSFARGAFAILCQEGLHRSSRSLCRVYLVNDELQGEVSANLLAGTLPQTNICELVLSENELGNAGVTSLTRGIMKKSNVLDSLNLRSSNITGDGALALQGLLTESTNIVTLVVSNNDIGDTGTAALARGLQSTSCVLQKLDLCSTGMQSTGARAIAAMLRINKHLVELNLSFNDIGEIGASALSKSLKWNNTLQRLNLRRNRIGDTGAYLVAADLPFMSGLKELVLSKNNISIDGATALLQGLRSNVELEYLHVEEKLSEAVNNQFLHYIRLNKAGRRIFRSDNTVPDALWSKVYGRIGGDVETLYHFLTEKPDAIPNSASRIQSASVVDEGVEEGSDEGPLSITVDSPKRKKTKHNGNQL